MGIHTRVMASVGLALGLLAGCSGELAGPEGGRHPGALVVVGWTGNVPVNLGSDDGVVWGQQPGEGDITPPKVLVAPDTADAGIAFEVTTYTVGSNGCWRSDGQTVTTIGRVVVLRPYDAHSGSGVCTMALVFPAHRSTLVLTEAGEWTLRVEGRRVRMGDDVWEEPISAEKTIIVR